MINDNLLMKTQGGDNTMKNTKLANTASAINMLLKIVQGFLIAGFSLCAIFIPLTAVFGEKIVADASTLEIGCVKIKLSGEMSSYIDMGNLKLNMIATFVSMMVALAAGWYCIRVLRKILVPMKEGQPFASGISDQIKKLGWTVLIGGLLVEAGRMISDLFTVRAYRLTELISASNVESVNVSAPGLHPWFVFAALLLFFLSFVFNYGESLQRESDETL